MSVIYVKGIRHLNALVHQNYYQTHHICTEAIFAHVTVTK